MLAVLLQALEREKVWIPLCELHPKSSCKENTFLHTATMRNAEKNMQVIVIGKIANFEPGRQKQKNFHVFC